MNDATEARCRYLAACLRFDLASAAIVVAEQAAKAIVEEARGEYDDAQTALTAFESAPGVPKPEYAEQPRQTVCRLTDDADVPFTGLVTGWVNDEVCLVLWSGADNACPEYMDDLLPVGTRSKTSSEENA